MRRRALLTLATAAASIAAAPPPPPTRPNLVILLVESTDGRLFWDDSPAPLPHIRALSRTGVRFDATYSNAPVCCPSRGSLLTGRHVHNIPHWHNGLLVNGLWNNFEGLNANQSTLWDALAAAGYDIHQTGKTDWQDGGHSVDAALQAWTHNVPFAYNVSADGGWNTEQGVCASQGDVAAGGSAGPTGSRYEGDWRALANNTAWIASAARSGKPWISYQGFNIVHPPYATNEYWFNRVDPANVTLPPLPAVGDMHPCDFQSSMLKGCTPSDAGAAAFDDPARRTRLRRIYAAEVAEFDAMVGYYMDAVERADAANNTVFLVFADHGDMQLEHRSFYKMVAYEGSSHVPLLVSAPWLAPAVVTQPVQLIDLYPTLLELAGAPAPPPGSIDGYSLAPFLNGSAADPTRPPFVVSQFHGADIPASWYMLRTDDGWKYVVWGDGATSGPAQLFNLTADPGELANVAGAHPDVVARLDAALRTVVDYPAVSADVAQYEQDMFRWWTAANADWRAQLAAPARRWHPAWAAHAAENLAAVEAWLAAPPPAALLPCRNATVWPQ